ncbi:ribonuclease HII [Saccharomonospora piscinae]|uniref:Ribonuclease HII n=1 Tax=Saccharomonospora piscinae TaxID=687388 RepID=A0A1V8ZZ80_SACPI|nr:ribonuclease HII [Saccharomonospora piscinae]OQO90091.1 ribonuclease HII [Saccharomonospora piscinae]TLW90921.1 ribonuclease HII [Saccharomonospora piscinae]
MTAHSVSVLRPPRAVIRGDTSWALQSALDRRGLGPVAGVDEAGRGACAGPLVVASCVLRPADGPRLAELTDSKLLTALARDRVYEQVVRRAVDYAIVVIPPAEIDTKGIHVTNIEGMRRAVAGLARRPGYVLIDGFRVPGLPSPSMPVVKGDRAVACVAAASVLAKVTRDRIMAALHGEHPGYGFDVHKGYSTAEHGAALSEHGPCEAHRWSFANVAAAAIARGIRPPRRVLLTAAALQSGVVGGTQTPEFDAAGADAAVVSENGSSADDRWEGARGGARVS